MVRSLKESLSKILAKVGFNKKFWKHDLTKYIQKKIGSESIKFSLYGYWRIKDNRAKDKRGALWNASPKKL